MLPARHFYANLAAAILAIGMQWFIMGIFFLGYMPTFGTQPIDQQITIVVALITASIFFVGEVAMLVVSIRYERPSRQQEW